MPRNYKNIHPLAILLAFVLTVSGSNPSCTNNICELNSMRAISRVIPSIPTSDGAGVRLKRTIGGMVDNIDPFLLLDEFKSDSSSDYIAGFPDHPHRGFETVTYMLAGKMEHRDHGGNKGLLEAGSVQWMTAGRGIIHSEMPKQENGLMWGFQLWVNLPAAQKMSAPRYQDIPPHQIPEVKQDNGINIKVIAGNVEGVSGPVSGIITAPTYLDVFLPASTTTKFSVPVGHNGFVYVFEGEGLFGSPSKQVKSGELGEFAPDGIELAVETTSSSCRFLLISAKPIKEPIARRGPFVMNTREELMQAYYDYQHGVLQG